MDTESLYNRVSDFLNHIESSFVVSFAYLVFLMLIPLGFFKERLPHALDQLSPDTTICTTNAGSGLMDVMMNEFR